MKTRKILLILVLLFCIFGFAKVNAATDISKIEVNVQTPVVEQIPADITKVTVKANDTETFEVNEVEWYIFNYETHEYELWTDTSKGFHANCKYAIFIGYKRPNEYEISSDINITVNGTAINAKDIKAFNPGSTGDADFDYDAIWYEFGLPQPQKEIKKIEASVPAPIIGQMPADKAKITVKADSSETFEIDDLQWLKYDSTINDWKECTSEEFKENEKYAVLIGFKVPNKYGISQSIKVTVNGKEIPINDFKGFVHGHSGDEKFDYDTIWYEFGEVQIEKETDNKTTTPENGEKTESVKPKGDTTTAPGRIMHAGGTTVLIVITMIIAVIGAIAYIKNKELKGI